MRYQVDGIEFWKATEEAVKSPSKALEWLVAFRTTLAFKGEVEPRLPFAMRMVAESGRYIAVQSLRKMKASVTKDNPTMDEDAALAAMRAKYGRKVDDMLEAVDRWEAGAGDGEPREGVKVSVEAPAPAIPEKAPKKNKYGEFNNVLLSDEEHAKWLATGEGALGLLEELSSYLASSGRRYKSHYAVLIQWRKRRMNERRQNTSRNFTERQNDMVQGSMELIDDLRNGRLNVG